MNKRYALALILPGLALGAAACSPAPATPAAPAPAATTPAPGAASAGWGLDTTGGADRIKAAGLGVLTAEGTAEHYHAHLDVFVNGLHVTVPADIGFSFGADGQPDGISALHTHDTSGIVHIEAPAPGDTYTLGQVLTEWGVLGGSDATPGTAQSSTHGWSVYVNGTRQPGAATNVVLKAHDEVVLTYGTAPSPVPSSFQFPQGL
ncbi:hypothetical protein [Specibacter cremeus]|uniref:hypothetical protein n=1 Tax=Specibacter cremeus TaxID=1629051 RepID=UPI0013DE5F03|nr:hypothetical protein [Specibacter cremeus]